MKRGEYLWQSPHRSDWQYNLVAWAEPLIAVSRAQGLLLSRLADVGIALRDEASLAALTEDIVQTSAIEGETPSPPKTNYFPSIFSGSHVTSTGMKNSSSVVMISMMTNHHAPRNIWVSGVWRSMPAIT
ncbi:hypothetical protein BOTU111922_09605 [Bordetella tumulicola]